MLAKQAQELPRTRTSRLVKRWALLGAVARQGVCGEPGLPQQQSRTWHMLSWALTCLGERASGRG